MIYLNSLVVLHYSCLQLEYVSDILHGFGYQICVEYISVITKCFILISYKLITIFKIKRKYVAFISIPKEFFFEMLTIQLFFNILKIKWDKYLELHHPYPECHSSAVQVLCLEKKFSLLSKSTAISSKKGKKKRHRKKSSPSFQLLLILHSIVFHVVDVKEAKYHRMDLKICLILFFFF